MERETLSNNTEYQKKLREARIKGPVPVQEARDRMRLIELDYEHIDERDEKQDKHG